MPIIQAIWFITAVLDCVAEQACSSITIALQGGGLGVDYLLRTYYIIGWAGNFVHIPSFLVYH